jgi:phosphate transport system substrate-binding protein
MLKKIIAAVLLASATALTARADVQIGGAGSSFAYPALMKWFKYYAKVDKGTAFNYQAVGSGGGIKAFYDRTVDFGATDAFLKDDKLAQSPAGPVLHVPIVAGAVVLAYNLPDSPKLVLNSQVVADIFLGKIRKWNDPAIAALNSGVSLPDKDIVVVHRSDASGTTFIFTDYLSKVSAEWKSKVGNDTTVKWPTGLGGKGNDGISGQVRQLPGAIGYVELAYAEQNHLSYADLVNKAGSRVKATPAAVSAAMATATIPDDFRFSMVNAPGGEAWPISGPTWAIIYVNQQDAAKGKALVNFLKWAVVEGQEITPIMDYAPLPKELQKRILAKLAAVKY